MAQKKSFILRIDPELLKKVEKWAADEFRSTNGQLEWIIQQAINKEKRNSKKRSENEDNKNE